MTEARFPLVLGVVALVMELGAMIVLLVPEARTPSGASVWSWYWPLANTLYFLGLLLAGAAAVWAISVVARRDQHGEGDRTIALGALAVSVLAIVVNRVVNYR